MLSSSASICQLISRALWESEGDNLCATLQVYVIIFPLLLYITYKKLIKNFLAPLHCTCNNAFTLYWWWKNLICWANYKLYRERNTKSMWNSTHSKFDHLLWSKACAAINGWIVSDRLILIFWGCLVARKSIKQSHFAKVSCNWGVGLKYWHPGSVLLSG